MPITFTEIKLPYGWLGNMSAHPVRYRGKLYRTAEALFQALRFRDWAVTEAIRTNRSPIGAKLVAKADKDKMVVVETSARDVRNMERVLRLKLTQHPELAEELCRTGGVAIIEDVTNRPSGNALFWGAALQGGRWVGENYLGRLWMKLRDELDPRPKKQSRPTSASATRRGMRRNTGGNEGR